MGFFSRNKSSSNPTTNTSGAKNPQSGANSFSSSEISESQGESSISDANVPTVNLTEQRLQDWKAHGSAVGVGGMLGGGALGGLGGSGKGASKSAPPKTTSSHHHTTGSTHPNNLILLIERGQWAAAAKRAQTHEHEVRQLVKLRKTTKNAMVASAAANAGAEGGSSVPQAAASGGGSAAAGGGHHGSSSISSKRNLQISNVKCKALHHACQKLRSVHTTIYQRKTMEVSVVDPDASHENSRHASRRRIIEEDEYIEACKCILELIRIHPEACKERESRHGCLPLHLCVFSMCATPPPPVPTVVNASGNGGKGGRGHHRTNSSGGANSNTKSKRPPVASSRSVSAPLGTTKPPTTPSNHSNNTSGLLPMQQLHPQHIQSGKAGHRSVHSNSSADFSLGNISQMIQEESEHQQALTDHQRSTKNLNNSNSPDASPGAAGGEEVAAGCGGSIEDQIYQGMEDMERLLIGLESKYEMKEDKRKRDKRLNEKNKDVELVEQELTAAIAATAALPSATTTTTTTTVVNAMTPMDSLEEQSRETDSHSTPQVASGSRGNSSNESSNGIVSDGRTGASVEVVREGEVPKKLPHNNAAENSKPSKVDTPSGSAHSIGIKNSNNNNNKPIQTTTTSTPSIYSSAAPTYEELQRRYLQINTLRRDEYSVRVLNALLDAWPKSIKTSSEGGRLPLHMACFGKATVKVMETILKAYPDAARQRNHDGFLPVHIAAHWGVSHPDIAPLILRAYPDGAVGRNRWERTPIEEALGMAGENGRPHQLSLVWSLRRHPTYWIHNDVGSMLAPRNVRMAPWRLVETGETLPGESVNGGGDSNSNMGGLGESRKQGGGSVMSRLGGGAVDVDEVGSSDEEDEGVEVQMAQSSSSSPLSQPPPSLNDPAYIRALAQSTELSLLITKDKHWKAASLRCRSHPHEAREALEVKVRGAYTARITPLHYACENHPTVEVVRTLIEACPVALERRQEPGGQLPLHAACTWGASSEVVSTLLAARPSTAEMKDFLSNLPLHCACYSGAETVVVAALLRAYPQGVWPRNHQGSSAVDIVRRLSHPNRREVLGLLERTMGRLLERATAGEEEGVEVDQDNSLEWV